MLLFDEPFIDGWLGRALPAGPIAPSARPVLPASASLGFSSHSFLYQAVAPGEYGNLGGYWAGALDIAYEGFSSLKQRWDANGVDRSGNYTGALIVTEIGDLVTGLADPASPQGVETLQYLYWYALTAQAKGCALFAIDVPHSPEGSNLDADAMAKAVYWQQWLRARPEITIPVYLIPRPVMVRAMIERFAPASIYGDGLHLKTPVYPAPNQMNNAMGQMIRMFLTGARPVNDLGWNAEMIGLVDSAWSILQAYACTGLGGSTVVAPYPVASDPLPVPVPHPDALSPHYGTGPGRIAIHFDTDHTTRDGSGNVTALQNRGGGGAVFDATVSGAAIPVSGGALSMTEAGGYPVMANAASLDQVRFMWVCSTADFVAHMRLFGGAVDEVRLAPVLAGPPPNTRLRLESIRTGSTVFFDVHNNWNIPAAGLHLFELGVDIAGGVATVYLDGVQVSRSTGMMHTAFLIDRIGQGRGSTTPFSGRMGDVLGVTLGAGDAAAIAAARAYLAARHGVVLA